MSPRGSPRQELERERSTRRGGVAEEVPDSQAPVTKESGRRDVRRTDSGPFQTPCRWIQEACTATSEVESQPNDAGGDQVALHAAKRDLACRADGRGEIHRDSSEVVRDVGTPFCRAGPTWRWYSVAATPYRARRTSA